jgi:predicted  nucleic acid-binding Zn-ribbon protein
MRNLIHLYEVDRQVRSLRSRVDAARRFLAAQVGQIDGLRQQIDELQTRRRHQQATTANLEIEMSGLDGRIEKLRDQLNSAVTNKQYSALLLELNSLKTGRAELETRILDEMAAAEQMIQALAELEGQVVARDKVRQTAEAQLAERQSEVAERLSELEAEREQAAACVAPEHLAMFEHLSELHNGDAMARIEEIDRRDRDYACGECHMTVPFEQVAVLASGGQALVRCTACGRLLYLQEETRGALR